jgi:hypothetical protein
MPLYNVVVSIRTQIVVVADDEKHASQVAQKNARTAIEDVGFDADISVLGEVKEEADLTDGWDGRCLPYGDSGNIMIRELLKN